MSRRYACSYSQQQLSVASPSPDQLAKAKSFDDVPQPVNLKGVVGFIANIYDAWRKDTFKRAHLAITQTFKEIGPIYKMRLGNGGWAVYCSDPKDVEFVYHNDGKYPARMHIEAWREYRRDKGMPMGVLIDNGEAWAKQRNVLSKRIMRPLELAKFTGTMNEVSQELIGKLRQIRHGEGGGGVDDDSNALIVEELEDELSKWAMESSCKFFFDRKLNLLAKELKSENKAFFQAITDLTANSIYLMAFPLKLHKRFNSGPLRKTNAAWDKMFELSKKYVEEKTQHVNDRIQRGENADDGSYLAHLIAEGKLSNEQIYSNMTELLAASIDTTASTSTWMLHLLSRHPDIQAKLYEEVMRVIPEDIHPTRQQIDDMPYVKAMVKETLRLYPVTGGTARHLPVDTIIHGYHIPADIPVLTYFYSSGRNPDNYEDPNDFQPERWLTTSGGAAEKKEKHNPFASQPFGFGTRMCLGRRLAEQELYLLACQISRNFILESTTPDVGSVCNLLITPEKPLRLRFIDRAS